MKTQIHPTWYPNCQVTCACGKTFTTGATVEEIKVEICSACHPFFTGQMKYIDTAGRVDRFKIRQQTAHKKVVSKAEKRRVKKEKQIQKELERPDTLTQLRSEYQKTRKTQPAR